ncbi:ShlB/FhaC/HecB family hemolysin secretion/activation protein [Lacinutrix jangbogonensis]|uniref:ShlB/FhaC/HecB family hemolysin secretion/activation protein n=1 Tax=Lacinutrix jangbogonensis TaxID=1469557 RepID=UPI00068E5669|nr:ShlB/FhaC/HecB family hemolysin secretion/activation protein [Lacinutrix jangbogonensis]
MHRHITFLFFIIGFCSTELHAQNLNLNLKIIGETNDETEIIEGFIYNNTHIDYNSIINEADSLQQKIIKSGYIESERNLLEKINDSSFQIQFQLHTKYDSIQIHYNTYDINKKIIDNISQKSFDGFFNTPFSTIEQVLQNINTKIAQNGFPFTKTKLSGIKIKKNKTLVAQLIIIKNQNKRSLDNIVIKGYEKFPKTYLRKFLKITPEQTFNIETIKRKLNAIKNIRFAKQTKAPEVLFTKDSTTLYIYLEKSKSNTFDGFLGFSTNEETNKIDFNGYINLELNNNLNYGESFNLIYKSDESEQKNFEINLNMPYLFSSPIGTEISLKIIKRDSSFTSINQKANVFYQLNQKNRIFLGLESTESNNLLDDNSNLEIADYKSNLYNVKYIFENRQGNNSLFQIKSNVQIKFGLGKRKTSNASENQKKIEIDGFHSFQLNKKNSIYTRLNAALIDSDNYYENELFRFGGINSIRGFKENSILANNYILLNTEYRYLLSTGIYAHTIIDFTQFENEISNTKENLYGFGFGFGITTKAGLLRFNFANGKTATQNFKFSNSKIHLSLISLF